MTSPSVFISYSHKDEDWKDRVVMHLRVLEMEGMLDVWDDRRIEAGDDWFPEIEKAINAASIAILLISANFLTSKFIRDEEVSRLLTRREKEGVRVIPVIVKPCAWTQVKWLSPIQARPKDGRALSAGNENQIDTDLAALAEEIAKIVHRVGTTRESPLQPQLPPDKISLAKLPSTSPDLFGREKELKELDGAWNNPHINVMTLVAWGGVGKSALINKWLTQMAQGNYRGAERVYGWSFYSQGAAEGRLVSADQFIASALAWFGDPDPNLGSPWDKGGRLAELVKQSRTLIILDGLEPLQNPPPVETGRIKDPALVAFLRELARQNRGLVVITTRLAVDDLKDCVGDTVIERDLENLSDEAGAAYLRHLGVDGSDAERQDASRGFGGHALALTLMGRYLVDVFDGECCKRGLIPHLTDEEEKGGHAKCIMRAYEKWFEGMPECDLLTLMGLFDRPAEKGALDALLAAPVIDGLTNKIQGLSNEKYKLALKHLRKARLLAEQDSHEPDTLDCHPLLREHINEQLKEANLAAWREGNNRLYEYYKSAAKEFPDTIQEMAPLFAAILHGCQAERHQEVFNDVLWKRIKRQDKYYDTQILGAYGEDLAALSNFFEIPWIQPISSLESIDQASVLAWAGFHLRNLGRLGEAIDPLKAGLDTRVKLGRWERAAVSAGYLSEACLMLGNIQQAFDYSRQGVEFAERCNNLFWKGASRAIHANVLHHMGKLHEAEDIFRNIGLQRNLTNLDPYQYSVWGFYANDLLLSLGFYSEVVNKVKESLDIAISESRSLLDIALNKLILGRAYLLESQQEENHVFADKYTEQAMNDLRSAGTRHHLLYGLLARVEYYRVTGAFDKSQKDLDEAFSISTRGGMGLFLADCHLEYGRLALAQKGDHKDRLYKDKAREHLKTAKEMIAKMGYHRRDKEVEELEKEL